MFLLNLFADGADSAPAGEAAEASTETSTSETSTEGTGSQPEEEKLYTKTDMSNAVKERVKNFKAREAEANERINAYGELHRILADRYGTDDIEQLQERLLGDDLYIEQESIKRNMSKEATRLQIEREYREKREFERAKAEAEERERQENVTRWRNEEAELQKTFPNFDLTTEFEDPTFAQLLISGVPVRSAYMALHADDIIQGGVQVAFERGKEAVASSIQANAKRPLENGVSSKPAVNTKKDISKLTKAEMDDIDERVRRGERITFR